MLGWILLGLLATAVVVVVINGIITKSRIKEEMVKQDMNRAVIEKIDTCQNKVSLKDLESGKVLEIQGDDVAYELDERDRIYA